jgi:two-component system LytT family response regulator
VTAVIRAAIVDDEPLSRRAVAQLLERHEDFVVVAECGDSVAAAEAMARETPDVLFLDIRMPGLSGLELARASNDTLPLVVFVTAFDEFALPAFEVDAVDFVRKPITDERFAAALERVRARLALLRAATGGAAKPGVPVERLIARVGRRDVVISLESVDYIAAEDVYARVHARGRNLLVRTSLDTLERQLGSASFLRVHRSYIVAVRSVVTVRRDGGRRALELTDGSVVPVSRRRAHAVLERVTKAVTA